jgi:hypothetical protein
MLKLPQWLTERFLSAATPSGHSGGLVSKAAICTLSRALGLTEAFHLRLLHLLDLGYKCRLRLPLFISAGFIVCHLVSNYVPRIEINVQVVEEQDEVIVVELAEVNAEEGANNPAEQNAVARPDDV